MGEFSLLKSKFRKHDLVSATSGFIHKGTKFTQTTLDMPFFKSMERMFHLFFE